MRVDHDRKSMDMERRDIEYILPAYLRLYLFQMKNEDPDVITFPMFQSVPHPIKPGVQVPIEYVPELSPVASDIEQDGSNISPTTPESEAAADKKEAEYETMKKRIAELEAEVELVHHQSSYEYANQNIEAGTLEKLKAKEEDERQARLKPKGEVADKPEEAEVTESQPEVEEEPKLSAAQASLAAQTKPESAIAGVGDNQPSAERAAAAKEPDGGALPPGTPSDYGGKRDARDQKRVARDVKPDKKTNESEEREDEELDKRLAEGKGKKQ